MLLALSIYGHYAGIVGTGLNWLASVLTGLGRFVLPVAVAAIGVALVSNRKAEHRLRLVLGWVLVAAAVLGVLHVLRGPHHVSGVEDDVKDGGGWLGAVIGEPPRSLLATAGASVLVLAVGVAGAVIATRASLRTLAENAMHGARAAGRRPRPRA